MEEMYRIALGLLSGIGAFKAKLLVSYAGGVEAVFKESEISLGKIEGVGSWAVKQMDRRAALNRAEAELKFIEKHNIQTYFYQDPNYPRKLKACPDGPICLFTKGKLDFSQKNVAVVGTRKSTSYGRKMVNELVDGLSHANVQIISGLAHGIDKQAHEAAIRNQLPTIGVLGHGLDYLYPAANRHLAKQMLDNGGLVTEYVSGIYGDPANFPQRNRIVAGLCDATVVVESAESGGSLITANLANDYDREVFAFPGNATASQSKGCNNLIRRNIAHLITGADDLLQVMEWKTEAPQNRFEQSELFEKLNDEEQLLVDILKERGVINIDQLTDSCDMPNGLLSMHLFNLEMKGAIKSLPGKRYSFC